MPNRQRTMHSFYTTTGARLSAGPVPQPLRPVAPRSRTAEAEETGHHGMAPGLRRITPSLAVSGANTSPTLETAVTAPLPSAYADGEDAEQVYSGSASDATGEDDSKAEQPEAEQSYSDWARQAADELMAQRRRTADARSSGTASAPHGVRHRGVLRVPQPWGVAPQQDALRGVIAAYDSDGRCSYGATYKCHSTHNHWSRCLVVDHPEDADFWSDNTKQYTSARTRVSLVNLVRCERCAVGIHPACAVDYSEWSGKVAG